MEEHKWLFKITEKREKYEAKNYIKALLACSYFAYTTEEKNAYGSPNGTVVCMWICV